MEPVILVIVFILLGVLVALGLWAYKYFTGAVPTTSPAPDLESVNNSVNNSVAAGSATSCSDPDERVNKRNAKTYATNKDGSCVIRTCKTNYIPSSDNLSCVREAPSSDVDCAAKLEFSSNYCINSREVGVSWKWGPNDEYYGRCSANVAYYNVYMSPSGENQIDEGDTTFAYANNRRPILYGSRINGGTTKSARIGDYGNTNRWGNSDMIVTIDPFDKDDIPIGAIPLTTTIYSNQSKGTCDSIGVQADQRKWYDSSYFNIGSDPMNNALKKSSSTVQRANDEIHNEIMISAAGASGESLRERLRQAQGYYDYIEDDINSIQPQLAHTKLMSTVPIIASS